MTDSYDEPEGLAPRGTVLIAPGRGENAAAYRRLGLRLSFDAYRVRILPSPDVAETEKLLVDDALPGPRVVLGSDAGALFALALARRQVPGLDGIVLAGLPAPDAPEVAGWEAELQARTACPTHQGVLANGAVTPGALSSALIPISLIDVTGDVSIPTLAIHGSDDTISPLATARQAYPGPVTVIAGGRHDILNDVTHRTVAATIVLFLERLRLGADLPVIAQVAS